MPVHGMNVGECPGNAAEAEATCYFCVLINIARVIVVNEVVPERLAKDNPRKHCQSDTDADSKPPGVDFRWAYRLSSETVHALRSNECRRTKEIQMTKPQKTRRLQCVFFAIRALSFFRHSPFGFRHWLGFPLVDQNVFSQLWHRLWYVIKIIICSVWCDHVHETGNSIVLRRVFISPGENHPLGFRSLQPRIWHYHKDEKFWASAFNLANYFLLHLRSILLGFHQAVSINVAGCGMPVGIKINLRLGA